MGELATQGRFGEYGGGYELMVADRIIHGREHFFDLYAWDEFWS